MNRKNALSQISRRQFLKLSGGLGGGALLGASHLPFVSAAPVRQDLSGQVVVSISAARPPEVAQALVDAYKAVRPNVEVIWEEAATGASDYPTWLGTQVASNEIRPDVVSGNYFKQFQGYLNYDQYRFLTNPHTGRTWDEDLDWNFFVERSGVGERMMLPTRAVHINWFYNKEMFETANVVPPTNWDEFVEVCDRLKEALPDIVPVVANYVYQVPQWLIETYMDQYHLDWIEVARAQEGDWNYNPDLDSNFVYDPNNPDIHNTYTFSDQRFWAAFRDGTISYNSPGLVEITRNIAKIFPKHATSDFFVINDPYPRFISGQAAIMYNGTWAVASLVNDGQTITPERLEGWNLTAEDVNVPDWGTFEMPPMEGPLVKSPVRSIESAAGEYVSIIEKDQAQTDLSLDFVQFWLSYAGYQSFNDASVTAKVNFSGPLKVYDVEEPEEVTALWKDVKFLGNAEVPINWQILYFSNDELTTTSRNMWKSALEGTMTPEAFAEGLQTLVMDNFDTILEASGLTQADLDNPAKQPGT